VDEEMRLNEAGRMALGYWLDIPQHFPNIVLDEFVIMPNHVHGILVIRSVGDQDLEPLQKKHEYQKIILGSIGSIIRGHKAAVTTWFRTNTDI
jgi:REP element-mobilizing transposase RayT